MIAALGQARARTHALVAHLSDAELERSHSPIMSPLVWDLAHIAAYEDLWLAHRIGGVELLRPDLAQRYDAFETPRAVRTQVKILDAPRARGYMQEVRERAIRVLAKSDSADSVICEMVVRHELQHTETMRQTLALAGMLPPGEPKLAPLRGPAQWRRFGAGTFELGACARDGFSYDNERPRHPVTLHAFEIARQPVSNEQWLRFSERGGYEQRAWWSRQGWRWKTEQGARMHPAIAAGEPLAPACHVCWFEAEAFACAHGARLPSEAEWERAARARALDGAGQVWEWTASRFSGYPGFRAHPYREYSEVFFGERYHVLRGSSWATAPRLASVTFRNWDLPQRRQIFAGVRLARDLR